MILTEAEVKKRIGNLRTRIKQSNEQLDKLNNELNNPKTPEWRKKSLKNQINNIKETIKKRTNVLNTLITTHVKPKLEFPIVPKLRPNIKKLAQTKYKKPR